MKKGAECVASLTYQLSIYQDIVQEWAARSCKMLLKNVFVSLQGQKKPVQSNRLFKRIETMTWNSSLYHLDRCSSSLTFLCCGGFIKAVQWRVCKLSRNKGLFVSVCDCAHTRALVCVSMSYPLRSSLSSAATLRNSASISSSS